MFDLEEMKAALAEFEPGEWDCYEPTLIANAYEWVTELVAEVQRLRGELTAGGFTGKIMETAQRRLKLLELLQWDYDDVDDSYTCICCCASFSADYVDERSCSPDCELAKELGR